ncbi:MAG: nuclease-related domain-containing protein [Cyanobacteria bacterium J06614_10]
MPNILRFEMIIKEKDAVDANLKTLEGIARLPNLSKEKRSNVTKEIKKLRSGNKGEQSSAYFIDFYFKDSKNWAVIHDLRLEYNGLVAQIDHLLINRFCDFYVLETKHYARGVKVTERGEFLVLVRKHYIAIESPIEQNKRHIKVLKQVLKGESVLPKRLGISLQANCLPYILVSPTSRVIRPSKKDFNTDMLIKADELHKQTQENIEHESLIASVGSAARMISQASLQAIAKRLVSHHKPIAIDYYAKFGIDQAQFIDTSSDKAVNTCATTPEPTVAEPIAPLNNAPHQEANADKSISNEGTQSASSKRVVYEPTASDSTANRPIVSESTSARSKSKYFCCSCKCGISKKVATFCFSNKARFKGKAYCFTCQKRVSRK